MPLIATKGAASAQGFGEFAQSGPAIYIEDVFSTYLYTGNGSTQTITNNIDLSTKGGLVWIKDRTTAYDHQLYDTARGANKTIRSNLTNAEQTYTTALTSFNTNGFSLGSQVTSNNSGDNLVSWTFRKQPKFFDIVTYTGNGSNRTISHNLGSVPGCIIIKCTSNADGWRVYHRSTGAGQFGALNGTSAFASSTTIWNNTSPTSTEFSLGAVDEVNRNSSTYVAYLFAHNAGGFGLTGSDNVITCGSFVGAGSTTPVTVNLGYEPQWMLAKNVSTGGSWVMVDTIRGFVASTNGNVALYADSAIADDTGNYIPGQPTATGLNALWTSGETYIYIAIRRGPMKTPTSGTSVFAPVTLAANGATNQTLVSTGFPVDLQIGPVLSDGSDNKFVHDRLRGGAVRLYTNTTGAEEASNVSFDWMTGMKQQQTNATPTWYMWRRAPGFFDEVCYTGTGSTGLSVSHNLGVMPELIIIKRRDASVNWAVGTQFASSNFTFAFLNTTGAGYVNQSYNTSYGFYAQPTSTAFTLDTASSVNSNAGTYVAYLFASVAGVSKVGSYTGTGALQTVNCGFTTGARFVLIKRTDSTGDWWVYDSARGITSGNDPYLFLNSTAAEVTGTNYVDTTSVGFQVTAAAPAGLNANGGTYIFLAIA